MLFEDQLPFWRDTVVIGGWHGGKIVAIGIVTIGFVDDIRLIQPFTIAIGHAIAQMNAIPGNAHDPPNYVKSRFSRAQKDNNISSPYSPTSKQGTTPIRRRPK